MGVWEDVNLLWFFKNFSGERVNNFNGFKRIKIKLEAISYFTRGWEQINRIAFNSKIATFKSEVIAMILHGNEIDHEIRLIERAGTLSGSINERWRVKATE